MRSFPLPAPGQTPGSEMRDIFFNGSATEPSFGCASWLLLHRGPDPMGIMVDVPRFSRPLLKSIEALAEPVGGVKYIFLTHRDDVFNHERWAEALPGVKRIIHRGDVRISQRTDECEVQLADEQLPFSLTEGCEILHVPGHTEGSLALLHRPTESIFTGDHLSYYARQGVITADPSICKHSWDEQIASVERLADVPFLHMYPGHGMHCHFDDAEDRMRKMRRATEFMRERFSSWDVASTKEWEQVGVLV